MNKHNIHLNNIAKAYVKKELINNPDIQAVFLVGSVAKGQAEIGSDIDLLIITKSPLAPDQQDNMEEITWQNENISLLYSNLDLMKQHITEEIMVDLCFSIEAVPIYDPSNMIKEIKKLSDGFQLNINLKARVSNANDGLKDAKRLLANNKPEEANIVALTTSFFLIRGYVQSFNSPYTSAKHLLAELKKYDPSFFTEFKKIWQNANPNHIISCLERQILYLQTKINHS